MKVKIAKESILTFLLILSSNLTAQNAGTIDKSYSNGFGGTVTTNMQNLSGRGQSLTMRDGKILIAGTVNIGAETYFKVNRYNNNGTRDLSFGNGTGSITSGKRGLNKYECYGNAVIISPNDAGIFVAGSARVGSKYNDFDFSLMKIDYGGTFYNLWPSSTLDGIATNALSGGDDFGNASAIQQDGKIVVVGLTTNIGFLSTDFGIIRYNSDGTLDNTFSGDGIQITDISGNDAAFSVFIQPDNKILVSGKSGDKMSIVRYNSDGSLDNTFGTGGKKIIDIGSGAECGFSLALQTNGKIVVAGKSNNGANDFIAVVRLNTDGTIDNTFSSDGIQTTIIGSGNTYGYAVSIQSDGKIIVGGGVNTGVRNNFALVRYNIDGSLDNNFSEDGIQTTEIGDQAFAYSMVIQSDGKVIIGGYSKNGSIEDFALVRYNIDGSLDNTFSFDGKIVTNNKNSADGAFASKLQSDGKLVVVGASNGQYYFDFALARYNPDGSLDKTFGNEGKQLTDVFGFDDYAHSIDIQTDGKILVAGYSSNSTNNFISIARYNTDGSLDKTFSGDGIQTGSFGGSNSIAYSIALQTNGKILVGGHVDGNFALIRYNSDGNLDNTFSQDGFQITNLAPIVIGSEGRSIAIQSNDGKILLAGSAEFDFAVVRYNSDGSIDQTFNNNGIQIIDFKGNNKGDFGRSVAVQNDGKIILAGSSENDLAMVRFTNNGRLDSSFGKFGLFISKLPGIDFGKGVTIQADGKILAAGGIALADSFDFLLIRLNPNGTFDNTFGQGGAVRSAFYENGTEWANSIAIQADGQILLVGTSIYGNIADFALARYSSVNGTGIKVTFANAVNVKIYPNPTSKLITIEYPDFKSNSSYSIINSIGQTVLTGCFSDYITTIDISNLINGFYLIKVGETEQLTFKIIKE